MMLWVNIKRVLFFFIFRWLYKWCHWSWTGAPCCVPEVGPGSSTSGPCSKSCKKRPRRCPNSVGVHVWSCPAHNSVPFRHQANNFANGGNLSCHVIWAKEIESLQGFELSCVNREWVFVISVTWSGPVSLSLLHSRSGWSHTKFLVPTQLLQTDIHSFLKINQSQSRFHFLM